jgi:nitroreductase
MRCVIFDGVGNINTLSFYEDNLYNEGLMVATEKIAETSVQLNPLIAGRWSPRAFDPSKSIDTTTLLSILEAGRWAASSSNIQPWRFIVAHKDNPDEFQKALSVIKEGNQAWAQHASVLMIGVINKYRRPDVLNRHASHDLGLAIGQMILQALDHDIYARMMGGFYPDQAREAYTIPDEYEPFTAIAFGYKTLDLGYLNEGHREKERATRERRPLSELVFSGSWAQTADFVE